MKRLKDWTLSSVMLSLVSLTGLLALQGCVQTTQEEFREANTGIGEDQIIAILRRASLMGENTEQAFIDCVTERTAKGRDKIDVISNQEFIDTFFPWFEPRIAPTDIDKLKDIAHNDKIKDRLESLGIRYLVWIDGTTKRINQNGSVQCAVATGGIPACFGFLSWRAESVYEAVIWDVERSISVGKLSSESKGMSFVPAVVIPIPFIARTQSSACSSLADQLKAFIEDGQEE
ncbi:MAG: hypothetical protein F4227_02510 [Gammaproteobacteria bacterium]|nr:hypothetical protein [Gammaproteobacteria bacterium]MYF01870.1 hypothetical protein [Gammaproteobacteria bacterium]MYI76343.1 hypothetical protein [Gammaproteobacteria bacterium]